MLKIHRQNKFSFHLQPRCIFVHKFELVFDEKSVLTLLGYMMNISVIYLAFNIGLRVDLSTCQCGVQLDSLPFNVLWCQVVFFFIFCVVFYFVLFHLCYLLRRFIDKMMWICVPCTGSSCTRVADVSTKILRGWKTTKNFSSLCIYLMFFRLKCKYN